MKKHKKINTSKEIIESKGIDKLKEFYIEYNPLGGRFWVEDFGLLKEFYIEYNPYKVECIFKFNGKEIHGSFSGVRKKRLQFFLEKIPSSSWTGLPQEIGKITNEDRVKIIFRGRKIDFEDLQYCIEKYSGDIKFTLEHIDAKNDEDILKEIDSIVSEFDKGPIEELKDLGIKKTYEEVKNSEFPISVIATMSCGKSTLINSLIGTELLPSGTGACTSTIARIKNDGSANGYTAESRDENDIVIHERRTVSLVDIKKFNEDEKVKYIDIVGKVPAISSEKINLVLVDTPGPNSYGENNHEQLTKEIIKNTDSVILYVFTPEAIDRRDDMDLLEYISDEMKKKGKQSKDRFIFVLNKCDNLKEKNDGHIEEKIKKARTKLKEVGIEEANIFPVSGEVAKNIRMNQKGELDDDDKDELKPKKDKFIKNNYYHFEKHANLSPSCRVTIDEKLNKAIQEGDIDTQALIHTGIPALEEAINEYLEKYAYPIKIDNAIYKFKEIIEEKDMKARFYQAISLDEKLLEEVKNELNIATNKRKERDNKIEEFQKKLKEFEIPKDYSEKVKKNIDEELAWILLSYSKEEIKKVEKSEAQQEIDKFKDALIKILKKCDEEIKEIVKEQIFRKASDMLDEYKRYIRDIIDSINIPNYEFYKIPEFKQYNFDEMNRMMELNTRIEDQYEEQKISNPEKEGFWGWFKFWENDFIYVNTKVGEKEYINVLEIFEERLLNIQVKFFNHIDEIYKNTEKDIKIFKEFFNKKLKELTDNVDNILKEITENIERNKATEDRIKSNEEKLRWISKILKKIDNSMDL
jgi:hypothetical protein